MTHLWLIRHGQTDWNLEDRYQGQRDIPLNDAGLAQARRLAEYLVCQGFEFQALYSSDLQRATQTAEILSRRLNLPVQPDARLREIYLGSWEGKTGAAILQEFDHCLATGWVSPDGETVQQVAARMAEAASDYAQRHPQGNVLVVSHGFSLSTLVCLARQQPLEQAYTIDIQNAHPVKITWRNDGTR
jgi:broad specificity phosphatase PhoE